MLIDKDTGAAPNALLVVVGIAHVLA